MRRVFGILRRLFVGDGGVTSLEYAIVLTLLAAICVAGVRTIGANAAAAPARISDSLSNGSGAIGNSPAIEISVKDKPRQGDAGTGKGNGN